MKRIPLTHDEFVKEWYFWATIAYALLTVAFFGDYV